ncbi:hypothetical protein LBMAG01_03970 [Acidobacteriota bacterium]|nr:hypothetical protein LBMAG01_03970 [Acidobacteriota bacterium]
MTPLDFRATHSLDIDFSVKVNAADVRKMIGPTIVINSGSDTNQYWKKSEKGCLFLMISAARLEKVTTRCINKMDDVTISQFLRRAELRYLTRVRLDLEIWSDLDSK